jgi:hypothetical protein
MDPAFRPKTKPSLRVEAIALASVQEAARHPSPKSRPWFADPDYEFCPSRVGHQHALTRNSGAKRQRSAVLAQICGSSQRWLCPGEMSKSHRMVRVEDILTHEKIAADIPPEPAGHRATAPTSISQVCVHQSHWPALPQPFAGANQ